MKAFPPLITYSSVAESYSALVVREEASEPLPVQCGKGNNNDELMGPGLQQRQDITLHSCHDFLFININIPSKPDLAQLSRTI